MLANLLHRIELYTGLLGSQEKNQLAERAEAAQWWMVDA
jgi:hypothetical protein